MKIFFNILTAAFIFATMGQIGYACVAPADDVACTTAGTCMGNCGGNYSVTCGNATYTGQIGDFAQTTVSCKTTSTGASSGSCGTKDDDESQTIPVMRVPGPGTCVNGVYYTAMQSGTYLVHCVGTTPDDNGCGPTYPPCSELYASGHSHFNLFGCIAAFCCKCMINLASLSS